MVFVSTSRLAWTIKYATVGVQTSGVSHLFTSMDEFLTNKLLIKKSYVFQALIFSIKMT